MRLCLYLLLLVQGFVLMGFELLSSRYLHPYFGGGIETWAAIISTVLLAMMCGYFLGGSLADGARSADALCAATGIAALYLLGVAYWARPLLSWVSGAVDPLSVGLLAGAGATLFLPVMMLSMWTPFVVRILISRLGHAGRVAGTVYGIATFGNVIGALTTAFLLIPRFGTFAITLGFAVCLAGLALCLWGLRAPIVRLISDRE